MKKIIKKVGNSVGLYFTSEDCKIYNLKVGDIIELELFNPLPKTRVSIKDIKRAIK